MVFGKTNNYFSVIAIQEILKTVDVSDKKERQHFLILSLLYETAARVNEIINIRVGDIHLQNSPCITLQSQNTTRDVPLSLLIAESLRQYISENDLLNHHKLFVQGENPSCVELCRYLRMYVKRARIKNPYIIPDHDSVYGFRISRANHLYQAGYSLEDLHSFLGHTDINETKRFTAIFYH